MKDNFIITVTNNIENCPIEKYLDSICANLTAHIPSGIFSLGKHIKGLDLILEEATTELKSKAKRISANAIVGFKVDIKYIGDYHNIDYLLISVSGTACIVKYPTKDIQRNEYNTISHELLETEIKKRLIVKAINDGELIQEEWRNFLCQHPQKDIIDKLLDIYVDKCFFTDDLEKELISFIEKYFTLLSKEDIIDKVYSRYQQNHKEISSLIKNCNLFSPIHILDIARENVHQAIELLEARKDFYKKEDLVIMNQILHIFDSLPNTGKIEMVKGGLLSKDKEMFICENGDKNNKDFEFCFYCGKNIKGLYKNEVQAINLFRIKIEALSDFLLN